MNLLLIAMGLIALYAAFWKYRQTKRLLRTGIITDGKVIRLVENKDKDGEAALVEYFDLSNKRHEFQERSYSSPNTYRVGEEVKVIYDPNDKSLVRIHSIWGLYDYSILFLFLGVALIFGAYQDTLKPVEYSTSFFSVIIGVATLLSVYHYYSKSDEY